MPELPEPSELSTADLLDRIRTSPGLASLVAEAEATWKERPTATGDDTTPAWRTFEDAFPTFYEFTNRPR